MACVFPSIHTVLLWVPVLTLLQLVNFSKANLHLHVHQLHQGGPVSEELDEEDDITAAQHWILPCSALLCNLHAAHNSTALCSMLLTLCSAICFQVTFKEYGKASFMTRT